MNTADRSIRSVDAALRRRFEYFEVFPDANALNNYHDNGTAVLEVPDLVAGFVELNSRGYPIMDSGIIVAAATYNMCRDQNPQVLAWARAHGAGSGA